MSSLLEMYGEFYRRVNEKISSIHMNVPDVNNPWLGRKREGGWSREHVGAMEKKAARKAAKKGGRIAYHSLFGRYDGACLVRVFFQPGHLFGVGFRCCGEGEATKKHRQC